MQTGTSAKGGDSPNDAGRNNTPTQKLGVSVNGVTTTEIAVKPRKFDCRSSHRRVLPRKGCSRKIDHHKGPAARLPNFAARGRAFYNWFADESRIPDGYSVVTFQP